jgi:hypothetical protein
VSPREQCEHGYAVDDCATCWKSVLGALGDTCGWGACTRTATRRVRMTIGVEPELHKNLPIEQMCDKDFDFTMKALGGVDLGLYVPAPPPPPPRLAGMDPVAVRALAHEHGWVVAEVGAIHFTVRRTYVLPTPEHVLCSDEEFFRQPFGHWNDSTYPRHEFLTFHFTQRRLRGSVTYGDAVTPWVGRRDGTVSQRRAADIITAAPPADATTREKAP